ncbi:MAG: archaeal flagellar protein FlaI, partial [Archaeoglobus sp.]|nr:archaeal flagellar protein FlaI [Archaeoglobus sp.]
MPKINFRQLKFRGKEQEESEEEEAEQLADYEKEALEAIEEVKQKEEILKVKREKKKIIGLPKRKEYSVEEHGELVEYYPPVGWSIVEEYWLLEPYCKAFIIYNEEEQEYRYQVVEPRLDPYETEVYGHLSVLLKDKLEENFFEDGKVAKEVVLKETFDDLISEVGFDLEDRSYYKIWYYIMRDFLYYDKITPLMLDKMLEDISCNGVRKYMYVFHRNYTNLRTNVIFDDPDELDSFVVNLAQKCGKHISI